MVEFEGFNTVPPHEREKTGETKDTGEEQTTETTDVNVTGEVTETGETQTSEQETPEGEQKPDEFIETFNKRYDTQYKTDDEIKGLFLLPGKVSEYEGKLKDHDELNKSVENYKKELEELRANDTSDLLNKPLIQKAFIAEQLKEKYPDRDADIMSSVVMSDIDKMGDMEAIAKERMINVKGITFDEAKLAKLADFGIDPDTNPEEWDSVAKARVKIAGAEAKDRIKSLLKDIELPKTVSKEERETQVAQALEDKKKAIAPIKEVFKKFDKYQNGDFEFVPPDEYKSKLDDLFDGMFIDSGLEVNEENLATAESLKRALFVEEYLPKMLEVHEKLIRTKMQEEIDAKLHNETPPNTATATDQESKGDKPGLSSFFQSEREGRATKL